MRANLLEFKELRKFQVDFCHGLITQIDGILRKIHSNPTSRSVFMMLTESFTYMSSFRYCCSNSACEGFFETHDVLIWHIASCHSSPYPSLNIHPTSSGQPMNTTRRYHEHSGYYTFGCAPNTFEQMNDGPFKQEQDVNPYYPFLSQGEWSLAKFLVENLTQIQIKKFLALLWVLLFYLVEAWFTNTCQFDKNPRPFVKSVDDLLGWMDVLLTGPVWKTVILDVEGYTTVQPLQLIWRDAEEVIRSLFGNLIFGADMAFDPVLIKNALGQEYSEWFSTSEAHCIQVRPLLALYESE